MVDLFVFYDDVNFIKKGWIHRNKVLLQDNAFRFTIPLKKVSQNVKINQTQHMIDEKWKGQFLAQIQHAYAKAPFYQDVLSLIRRVLDKTCSQQMISELAITSVIETMNYLQLPVVYKKSSELNYHEQFKGEDKILQICQLLGTKTYINAINGRSLYDYDTFRKQGISLQFLQTASGIEYKQFSNKYVPNLSIIDVLMFNSKVEVSTLLKKYKLV